MTPRVIHEGTAAHRRYVVGAWTLFVLVALLVPFVFADTWAPTIAGDKYTIGMDNIVHSIAWMVAVLGLNLLIGYSGQISLGHSFFVGVGAYLAGVLIVDNGWPWPLTFVAVIPVCFLVGMLVGLPALRIQGLYLALVTLVLATIFPTLVRLDSLADRTGGSNGLTVRIEHHPPDWLPLNGIAEFLQAIPLVGAMFGSDGLDERGAERVWVYLISAAIAAVMFWIARNIVHSRPGRAMVAIRDNETGAAVSGVDLARTKTLAFGLSAAYAGVAGVMYTVTIGALAPDVFGVNLAIFFIVGLVLGGVGTITGAVSGGLAIIFIPHLTRLWAGNTSQVGPFEVSGDRPYGQVLLGLFLIAITFVLPGGMVAGARNLRARFVRVVPRPPVIAPTADPFGGASVEPPRPEAAAMRESPT